LVIKFIPVFFSKLFKFKNKRLEGFQSGFRLKPTSNFLVRKFFSRQLGVVLRALEYIKKWSFYKNLILRHGTAILNYNFNTFFFEKNKQKIKITVFDKIYENKKKISKFNNLFLLSRKNRLHFKDIYLILALAHPFI